jgi:hypothetical protein
LVHGLKGMVEWPLLLFGLPDLCSTTPSVATHGGGAPSASFWWVLFICILSAALACPASRQSTLSSRPRNSWTSHGVIGRVSIPILASSPACRRTARSIGFGSDWHWPRQSLRPASSTTQIDVNFRETSKPTNRVIWHLPCVIRRATAPEPRHYGVFLLPDRDYPMSTYGSGLCSRC